MADPLPAYEGDSAYAFISYSHHDTSVVFAEIRWLQDNGMNVWFDTAGIHPGNEWSDDIAKHIEGCARFIYFITPNSVASENCRRELNFAIAEGRPILSVHLEKTEVPREYDSISTIAKPSTSTISTQASIPVGLRRCWAIFTIEIRRHPPSRLPPPSQYRSYRPNPERGETPSCQGMCRPLSPSV